MCKSLLWKTVGELTRCLLIVKYFCKAGKSPRDAASAASLLKMWYGLMSKTTDHCQYFFEGLPFDCWVQEQKCSCADAGKEGLRRSSAEDLSCVTPLYVSGDRGDAERIVLGHASLRYARPHTCQDPRSMARAFIKTVKNAVVLAPLERQVHENARSRLPMLSPRHSNLLRDNTIAITCAGRASRRKREGLKLGCTTQRIRAFKAAGLSCPAWNAYRMILPYVSIEGASSSWQVWHC